MARKRKAPEMTPDKLAKLMGHPLRIRIVEYLARQSEPVSPSHIAKEFGIPLPNLSYHIRMMVELGAIKQVNTRARRGAVEHFYALRRDEIAKAQKTVADFLNPEE